MYWDYDVVHVAQFNKQDLHWEIDVVSIYWFELQSEVHSKASSDNILLVIQAVHWTPFMHISQLVKQG